MSCDYTILLDPINFIDENIEVLNDYACPLCNGILFNPVSDKCNHFFCEKCINTYAKTNTFCPLDDTAKLECLIKAPVIQMIINNKYIYCKFRGEGCVWRGKVEKYFQHLNECEIGGGLKINKNNENPSQKSSKNNSCIYEGCNEKVENMMKHLKTNRQEHELLFQKTFKMFKIEVMEKFNKINKFLSTKRLQKFDVSNKNTPIEYHYLSSKSTNFQEKSASSIDKIKDEFDEMVDKELLSFRNKFKSPVNKLTRSKEIIEREISLPKDNCDGRQNKIKNISQIRSRSNERNESNFSVNTKEHSSNIEVSGNKVRVIGNRQEVKYRFAFANALLNFFCLRWKIKIIKIEDYIACGVCLKDEIISGCYKYTKVLNHSTIVISSNGYVWNCLNQQENGDYFEFLEINSGDIIEFYYDNPHQKLICYFKNNVITFTNVKANVLNFLVPCVILYHEGDEVEFIGCP